MRLVADGAIPQNLQVPKRLINLHVTRNATDTASRLATQITTDQPQQLSEQPSYSHTCSPGGYQTGASQRHFALRIPAVFTLQPLLLPPFRTVSEGRLSEVHGPKRLIRAPASALPRLCEVGISWAVRLGNWARGVNFACTEFPKTFSESCAQASDFAEKSLTSVENSFGIHHRALSWTV
jgi:hypothetical protein